MRGKRDALCDAHGVELCRGRSGKVGLWILAEAGGGARAAIRLDSPIDAGSLDLRAAHASGRALLAEMFSSRGNVPEEIAAHRLSLIVTEDFYSARATGLAKLATDRAARDTARTRPAVSPPRITEQTATADDTGPADHVRRYAASFCTYAMHFLLAIAAFHVALLYSTRDAGTYLGNHTRALALWLACPIALALAAPYCSTHPHLLLPAIGASLLLTTVAMAMRISRWQANGKKGPRRCRQAHGGAPPPRGHHTLRARARQQHWNVLRVTVSSECSGISALFARHALALYIVSGTVLPQLSLAFGALAAALLAVALTRVLVIVAFTAGHAALGSTHPPSRSLASSALNASFIHTAVRAVGGAMLQVRHLPRVLYLLFITAACTSYSDMQSCPLESDLDSVVGVYRANCECHNLTPNRANVFTVPSVPSTVHHHNSNHHDVTDVP